MIKKIILLFIILSVVVLSKAQDKAFKFKKETTNAVNQPLPNIDCVKLVTLLEIKKDNLLSDNSKTGVRSETVKNPFLTNFSASLSGVNSKGFTTASVERQKNDMGNKRLITGGFSVKDNQKPLIDPKTLEQN